MFTSELFIAHAKQNGLSVNGRKGGSREKLGVDAHRYSTSKFFDLGLSKKKKKIMFRAGGMTHRVKAASLT